MEYECNLAPCDRLAIGADGLHKPLCNDCMAPDCSNPIKIKTMSIFGVPTKMRLWVVHNVVKQVIACKGYISKDSIVETEDEQED